MVEISECCGPTHFVPVLGCCCCCCCFGLFKKEPFLCVLDEASQKHLYHMDWPADQSAVLLKRKQACDYCSPLYAAIELRDGRNNNMCALSRRKKNKITKRNSKYRSTYAYGAKLYRITIRFTFQWQRGNSANPFWIDHQLVFLRKGIRTHRAGGKVPKRQLRISIDVCPRSSAWNWGTEIASSFPLLLVFVTSHHV